MYIHVQCTIKTETIQVILPIPSACRWLTPDMASHNILKREKTHDENSVNCRERENTYIYKHYTQYKSYMYVLTVIYLYLSIELKYYTCTTCAILPLYPLGQNTLVLFSLQQHVLSQTYL